MGLGIVLIAFIIIHANSVSLGPNPKNDLKNWFSGVSEWLWKLTWNYK